MYKNYRYIHYYTKEKHATILLKSRAFNEIGAII